MAFKNAPRRRSARGAGNGGSQQGMMPASTSYSPQKQPAQQYSRYSAAYQGGAKASGGRKRWVVLGIVLLLVTALVVAGTYAFVFLQNVNNNLKGSYTETQLANIQEQLVPVTDVNEPFYVMLIGSDERADSDEMGARSDSNIVVRIDPVNWVVTMVSIPRDTLITFNGSQIKFNAAYAYGDGAAGTIKAASALCNVKISHYAEINFDGVVSLVDSIGGVEVDVPQPIDDPQAGDVTIDQAGLQTLNGAQALVFARSRHYYTDGDFSRSANQRALIEAIVDKVFSLPATQIPQAVQEMSKCVSTDMDVSAIYSLAMQYVNSGKEMTIYSIMAPSTTEEIDGGSYVVVNETELAQVMAAVDAGKDPNDVPTTSVTSGTFIHYDYVEGYD